jgi:proline dehydrogenase
MLRHLLLSLSRNRRLRRWFETSPSARPLTARFIAGSSLEDVLGAARRLQAEDVLSTLDHLGENVTTVAEADASREAMQAALRSIAASSLPATISIKLTQFGLDLGNDPCRANAASLARMARDTGSRVEIDMESSEYVDRTLAIVEHLHRDYGCVRCVLQAYLYRTLDDARRMNALSIPIRLCKGAYNEPAGIAFPEKSRVDENYILLARLLLDEGAHPAFATHDPRMIDAVIQHAGTTGRQPADFEFQMLYGIRRDLQQKLVQRGFRLRLYVPYGDAWFPYFMRRLAERPANLLFIARNLIRA